LADFPWQVVTQAGQVVTSFGGWVRGSETAAERLVSARRRLGEAQMRLDRLEPLLQQAAQERLSVERSIGTIESRLREVQDRALTIETELRLHKRRRDELSGSLRRLDEQLRGLSPADTPTQRAVSEPAFENQQAELSRRLEVLAQQEREAANGIHRLQASWEQAWAERESIRRVVDQFLADERAQRERLAERSREQERFRRDRDRAREAARQALEELAPMGDALDTLQEQMGDLARRIAMDDERVATLSDERSRLQSRLDGVESELSGLRATQTWLHPSREQALVARQQAADQLARLQAEAEAVTEEWGLGGEVLVQLRLLHPVSPTAEPAATADEAHLLETEFDLVSTRRRLVALQRELRAVGAVGESVLEEYREVQGRLEFLTTQSRDLIAAMQELNGVVDDLESLMREGFSAAFERVNGAFAQTFATLFGGGTAQLVLTDPDDPLRTGVEIVAQPPGKRLQNLMSLSGGERALTSTALIFALLAINPLPFCVLDEVDAALDEPNARRFAALLREYAERTQFIVITHNRATMETARALYGISMGGDGVTTVASLMPSEALAHSRNGRG
jgi:chromosome segregation protein